MQLTSRLLPGRNEMHYEELQPVKNVTGDLLSDIVSNCIVLRMLVTQQKETAGSVSGESEYVCLSSEY